MAEDASSKTTTLTGAFVLLLALYALVVPGSFLRDNMERELTWYINILGPDNARWIADAGEEWYDTLLVRTGIASAVADQFMPSSDQRARSGAMRDIGYEIWFPYVEGRGWVLRILIHQALYRIAMVTLWFPFFFMAVIPAVFDGLMEWRKRRYTFNAASPVMHSLGMRGPVLVLTALGVMLFVPSVVGHPLIPPLAMVLVAIMLRWSAIHTQKIV
ncbi:DUF4400 domain-containing protein [Azospirillum sp. sgz302134]